MNLRVRRLQERAVLPTRAHPGDAGLDLHALDGTTLEPGARAAIPTGLAVEIPEGHAGLVLPRSGLALRHGIALVNAPGLIDSGYRGELRVLLLNTNPRVPFPIAPGDRVAQLVVVRSAVLSVVEVGELSLSARGTGGFGSSGS